GAAALVHGLPNLDCVGPRAIAHERVIESFLSATALLPMQLFTLFTSDGRVIEHVRSDRARIARILERIENKVEWGLRLTYADLKGPRRAIKSGPNVKMSGADPSGPGSGTKYLCRKRDVLEVNRKRL